MIEIPGPIPIRIHPFFWLFASLIGWMSSGSFLGMMIWLGIILVSVLVHEFGHALTAIFFKQKARIELVALGGATIFEGPKLRFSQQFLITFNGPLFGFFLFLIATACLQLDFPPFFRQVLRAAQLANLFWTIVNLLPVLPLDGGQLLRIILEAGFGVAGFKASLLIGALVAAVFSLYFFLIQAFLVGAFFFLFAFQSFDSWRKSRFATKNDRMEENKELLMQAEKALQGGKIQEAHLLLEELIQKAKEGVLARTAQQYLAFLLFKEGKKKECYDLLVPIQEHLADDALCILHELAADEKNDPLVAELSAKCYQIEPSQKRALSNARSFARLKEAKKAGGWLQTAWQYGGLSLSSLLEEEAFHSIQENPEFQEFLKDMG